MATGDKKPARSGGTTSASGAGQRDPGPKGSRPRGSTQGKGGKSTSGTKAADTKAARAVAATTKPKPWGTIAAVVVVLALAAGIFGYAYSRIDAKNEAAKARQQESVEQAKRLAPHNAVMREWAPTRTNPDPSTKIPGVVTERYEAGKHVLPTQRVAYDHSPPFGGPHDGYWADCDGIAYPQAVRTENMVHALEHGTVWIAYNPEAVRGAELEKLRDRVSNQPFTMLSPYPGLDKPISLQSWGHQLKLSSADDKRIDQFIGALRRNSNTYPEVGASCDALGPGRFDPDNPPTFDPSKPGADAVPMTGGQKTTKEG
ncbi:MAG: DUF3105 domain-containing protein [Sciscionella sp.]